MTDPTTVALPRFSSRSGPKGVAPRWLAGGLALSLLLGATGCAGGGFGGIGGSSCSDPSLSLAEQQLCQDNATFDETVLGGAATGALAGAALGALVGALSDGGKGAARGAIIGGVGGGLLGAADGYATAKEQEASQRQVRAIDLVTADIQRDNARLANSVAIAQRVVNESRQRLASVQTQLAQRQITADQAQAERARIARNQTQLQQLVGKARETREAYLRSASQLREDSPQLRQQITQMERNINQLEAQQQALQQLV